LLGDSPEHEVDERRPSRLVGSTKAATGVAAEVLVEVDQAAPVWVRGKAGILTVAGTTAVGVRKKETRETCRISSAA
jgi:hypothetical protein